MYEGRFWYNNAYEQADRISNKYGISTDTVIGVIAALSPQNPWERNVLDADKVCYLHSIGEDVISYKAGTFKTNLRKAQAILNGESPEVVLGGLKVQNFYRCIKGEDDAVCVDGHAYSIWIGERVSTSETPKITPKLYDRIATDFKVATTAINQIIQTSYLPRHVQAITWLVHRRLYGGKRSTKK